MSQEAFQSKWSDIAQSVRDADERVLFVDVGEAPMTQRQLNLYYYFLFIKKILEEEGSKKVMEIGCGRGTIGLYMAKYAELDVSLLDNEKDAIAIAKRTFEKYGQRGAFYVGDALKTGLPDGSFDAVVSIGLAEHFESKNVEALFREQFRLLRHGGVVVSLNIPKKFSVQSFNTLLRLFKKLIGRYSEKIGKDYYRNTWKPETYKQAAENAGFSSVGITHVNPFPIFVPLGRVWDKKVTRVYKLLLKLRSFFQKYPYKTNRIVAQAHFLVGYKRDA